MKVRIHIYIFFLAFLSVYGQNHTLENPHGFKFPTPSSNQTNTNQSLRTRGDGRKLQHLGTVFGKVGEAADKLKRVSDSQQSMIAEGQKNIFSRLEEIRSHLRKDKNEDQPQMQQGQAIKPEIVSEQQHEAQPNPGDISGKEVPISEESIKSQEVAGKREEANEIKKEEIEQQQQENVDASKQQSQIDADQEQESVQVQSEIKPVVFEQGQEQQQEQLISYEDYMIKQLEQPNSADAGQQDSPNERKRNLFDVKLPGNFDPKDIKKLQLPPVDPPLNLNVKAKQQEDREGKNEQPPPKD